jgi:regulator of protease activity HflC (stomatin/prohibitin superfamily)
MPILLTALVLAVLLLFVLLASIRVVREYERLVVFRLGRLTGARGPGLILLVPYIERGVKVGLRTVTSNLATQETVTRDGVAVRVNAVLWHRVHDPVQAVVSVEQLEGAVILAAETTLRDIIGQNDLDGLLKARDKANDRLRENLSETVAKWGLEIVGVEIKDLDIPEAMQRAIAKEAEAIREQRARIIKAEGEYKAAEMLSAAAKTIAGQPGALELRRLQTLSEIGAEHNSTIVVAMPLDSMKEVAATTGIARAVAEADPKG